ncbi:hypothetical protein [Helicobacter canis]|uniref:Uncharacterized protein n=1 Tax=Helicobacter canis NCTC 12740 TaxID=1357399 RepID=V8CG71_9HELI|nr:hypothetical protein [Helicobacter canis]ETD25980.1 hypothetical protein HMPREF2087_01818 [Helicobacter canis NCTC 12740]
MKKSTTKRKGSIALPTFTQVANVWFWYCLLVNTFLTALLLVKVVGGGGGKT